MFVDKIILLTIVIGLFFCDTYQSSANGDKRKTTSRTFHKLRTNNAPQCQYINQDFNKMAGHWRFVLRTVTSRAIPRIRCGGMTVNETSRYGFKSKLTYLTHDDEVVEMLITGTYFNETVVEIPQLNQLVTGNPDWNYPFIVQMGICDDNSILFMEPIHYIGGSMVLTRTKPSSLTTLRIRFGTYDEESGIERTDPVDFNCTMKRHILPIKP